MICPFCRESEVDDNPGPVTCPVCGAEFRVDDRGEYVFVNTDHPRMPIFGQVFMVCGLVQQYRNDHCFFCGTTLNKKTH